MAFTVHLPGRRSPQRSYTDTAFVAIFGGGNDNK